MTDDDKARQLEEILLEASRWYLDRIDGRSSDRVEIILRRSKNGRLREIRLKGTPGAGILTGLAVPQPPDQRAANLIQEHFFSDTEKEIVLFLSRKGPSKGSAVVGGVQADNNTVRTLLANLVKRGILRVKEDGYELTDPLWELIAGPDDPFKGRTAAS